MGFGEFAFLTVFPWTGKPLIKGSQNMPPLLRLQELGRVLGAAVYDKINDKIGKQNRPEKETPILL